ncbi:peptidase S8/S53 domain-containing protein [Lactarius akahatsu]|uniref:tripeptidyl-peptidase II n=1 Tax=Lactarius akahatsu TaxID=416441 RepID=A0AAD4LGY7_9AGAM|nr:peptidase S8/S53 domain-containing protein [Lactarius akahatsu]
MHYRWIPVLFLLSAVPLDGLATSRWEHMRSKHSWKTIPENWESLGLPPADTMIDLYIALKPYRENALIDALNEVSDPGHTRYGAHLSREQVADIVAPHPDTVQLVHSWLEHHRVLPSSISVTHGGSFLTVTRASVSQANDLLGASYQLYTHTKTNETIIRTLGYSLPVALHGHVQTVAPTTFFSSPLTQWQTPHKRSSVAAVGLGKSPPAELVKMPPSRRITSVTPAFLRWLYNTFAYVPSATDRNVVGITGFAEQYPNPADLTSFMRKYRPDGIDATYVVELYNGAGYDPNNPGLEANIDLQLSEGMSYPTPHIFYSIKASENGDVFLAWLDALLSQESVPQTITTSYGDYEKLHPMEYATQICDLFAQLGARGASVLFSSGDHGIGEGDCKNDDGAVRFTPLFPATCPYVTAVGGTTSFVPEVAASLSGGGFSEYFLRPWYQQQAVYSGLYNPSGRGIPDVAAQAMRIPFFYRGREIIGRGTSCSTPIVAGIISLLNDHRLSQGRPPLGFLNPWLYNGGLNGFNDIVSGSNPGCNTDGFSAIAGWDPVTGLGTPDLEQLLH